MITCALDNLCVDKVCGQTLVDKVFLCEIHAPRTSCVSEGWSRSFGLFCWSGSLFNSGKTPAALICAANYCQRLVKKPESINEKVNTRIDICRHKHVNCSMYDCPGMEIRYSV